MATATLAVIMMLIMAPILFVWSLAQAWYYVIPAVLLIALWVIGYRWLGRVCDKYGIGFPHYTLVDSAEAIRQRDEGLISQFATVCMVTSKLHPDEKLYFISNEQAPVFHKSFDYAIRQKYGEEDGLDTVINIIPCQIE